MTDAPHTLGARGAPAEGPSKGDVIAERYRVDRLLGEGGMGQVYAGENLKTGKQVALKCLLNDRARTREMILRFQQEAMAAGRIDHPNVIQVYDVVEEARWTFLVMERLKGEPLSSLLKRTEKLPVQDAVAIVIEALRGVDAAHASGVVHRDIKPDNIFLCRRGASGRVKLLDFGVSKLTTGDDLGATRTGTIVGTPFYMSPEQVLGAPELDHRLDVYAIGAVLYHTLAGKPPFEADSLPALAVRIATAEVPPLHEVRDDVSEELSAIVEKAMARERENRFQDAASFATALEPYAGGVRFRQEGPEWTGRISTESDRPVISDVGHSSTIRAVSHASTVGTDPAQPVESRPRSRAWFFVAIGALALAAGAWWWLAGGDGTEAAAPGEDAADPRRAVERPIAGSAETAVEPPGEAPEAVIAAPATPELGPEPLGEGEAPGAEPEGAGDPDRATVAGDDRPSGHRGRAQRRTRSPPADMQLTDDGMMQADEGMAPRPRAGTISLDDF